MTAKISFEFSTNEFLGSHGRQPKGFGMWAFQYRSCLDSKWSEILWFPGCSYTDAKKAVKGCVKAKAPSDFDGSVIIKVCP